MQIRPCSTEDFDGVYKLLLQLWPTVEFNKATLQKIFAVTIAQPQQKLIVAVASDEVVGFCSLTIKNNFWQAGSIGVVDELVVDVRHQRQGIGKRLMERIESIAIENKCKRLELESSFHREGAHKFYETTGFVARAYWFSKPIV